MRILLIAHDFPPIPSPQSLRWAYLARELALRGHTIQVLTSVSSHSMEGFPSLPQAVNVCRVSGDPLSRCAEFLKHRHANKRAWRWTSSRQAGANAPPPRSASVERPHAVENPDSHRLNWKGRLASGALRAAGRLLRSLPLFPDDRGLWYAPASKEACRIVEEFSPDVVVSSHEPATSLQVGLFLKRRSDTPWVADLGDPVLAAYTPLKWKKRALQLESSVLKTAELVTVTTAQALELLENRHAPRPAAIRRISVVTQGFEDREAHQRPDPSCLYDMHRLEILYTGTFYEFRRPEPVLAALAELPDVRLSIASVAIPQWLWPALRQAGDRVRLLGFLPHQQALAVQKGADVLLNIANQDAAQVPGKVYEYLGSARPILHLSAGAGDASAELIRSKGRGWVCDGNVAEIVELLDRLLRLKRESGDIAALNPTSVAEFGWSQIGEKYSRLLTSLVSERDGEVRRVD